MALKDEVIFTSLNYLFSELENFCEKYPNLKFVKIITGTAKSEVTKEKVKSYLSRMGLSIKPKGKPESLSNLFLKYGSLNSDRAWDIQETTNSGMLIMCISPSFLLWSTTKKDIKEDKIEETSGFTH